MILTAVPPAGSINALAHYAHAERMSLKCLYVRIAASCFSEAIRFSAAIVPS